ncbi:PEP-CTERM sorting domain-containing protein [Caulifigura coniformis]|nr:PEP-CTERM sorting domain-containing protein [Caulifigura coniformis]
MRASFLMVILASSARTASAELVINVNFTGDSQFSAAFDSAAQIWQSRLGGYQNGFVVNRTAGSSYLNGQTVSEVFINAVIAPGDGVGNVLGSAGPSELVLDAAGFYLTTDGAMTFDSFDAQNVLDNGNWENLILHEMGHVLGFGTLWELNGVYDPLGDPSHFTGANAIAAWNSEFGQTGMPDVEQEGGGGTAGAHWNENVNGSGPTGIEDSLGRDMRDELMTGWLNPNSFISDMTVASFIDIGFTGVEAVPEPGTLALSSLAFGAAVVRRRRSRRRKDSRGVRVCP